MPVTTDIQKRIATLEKKILELERIKKINSTLSQLSRAIGNAQDSSSLYQSINQLLSSILNTSNFSIALYDSTVDHLKFAYWIDEKISCPPDITSISKRTCLCTEVLRIGRPLLLTGKEIKKKFPDSYVVSPASAPVAVWLGVPLRFRNETNGIMMVKSYTDSHCYDYADLELMTMVASHVSAAIQFLQAKDSLKESEERYSAVVRQASEGIYLLDPESKKIIDANTSFLEMIDYPSRDLTQLRVYDFVAHDENEIDSIIQQVCSATEKTQEHYFVGERTYRKTDGTHFFVETSAKLISCEGQKILCVIARDISERKRLEEQLWQAQKLESIGRLAGGIAHDFNNMLSVIIGHSELALAKLTQENPVNKDLQKIKQAAEHSAELTKQLLAFARKQKVSPEIIDVNHAIGGMIDMLKRLIGEHIELLWQPGKNLWPAKIDPMQLSQIMTNLCVNARDAISETGVITISTGNVDRLRDALQNSKDGDTGSYIRIDIADNGQGIDDELQKYIFEPFFTTKEIGRGTGLGLATVYGIIKQNRGHIHLKSSRNKGSTFSLFLPKHQGTPAESAPEQNHVPTTHGEEVILLVEDEPSILSMCKIILEEYGYKVLSASHPDEAFKISKTYSGKIDLLFSDVVMPGMNGPDMGARLKDRYPLLKQLFMSGYSADIFTNRNIEQQGIFYIQKPFAKSALLATISSILDQPKPKQTVS